MQIQYTPSFTTENPTVTKLHTGLLLGLALVSIFWTNIALASPPSIPQNLVGTLDEAALVVDLNWDASTDDVGVGGYNVYRNNSYRSTVASTSFSETVEAGDINVYYVTAFDEDQNFSGSSQTVTLPDMGEDTESPSAPTNLIGNLTESGGITTANLAWNNSTDNVVVSGYNVHVNNAYATTVNTNSAVLSVDEAINSFFVVAFDPSSNFSGQSNLLTLPDGDNIPPYFEGLIDVTGFAGETIEILVNPIDIDSTTPPGLFFESLPIGMSMTDNLDGTRTLSWPVLQPQVGQHDITVTATDAEDSTLTVTQTITVTVELPDDESTIPNLPPGINLIEPHIVRTGDTVIMHVRGTDPNGTIPTMTLNNLPATATFLPRGPNFPDVTVLTWETTAADLGSYNFVFVASDQIDNTLTTSQTVSLEIANPSQFIRDGSRLRDLADQNSLLFGFASTLLISEKPDADLYRDIAAEEFNFVTAENGMKWSYVNPQPGVYRWDSADELVAYAAANNMPVHGHTLVWYSALPQWVYQSAVTDRESLMNGFIDTIMTRYPNVAVWDVVNEAFEADGSYRNSVWYEAMGESHIPNAFERARLNDIDATLIYNDYEIATAGPKSDAVYDLAVELLSDNIPIDGIGFQMHIDTDFEAISEVIANFARFAALNLDVYITELDVSMLTGATLADQAAVYADVVSACLAQPRCKAVQTWGFTDRYSWLSPFDPLLFDRNYQPKPAYLAIQDALTLPVNPEDGSCGISHEQTLIDAPTNGLCSVGYRKLCSRYRPLDLELRRYWGRQYRCTVFC